MTRDIYRMRTSELALYVRLLCGVRLMCALFILAADLTLAYAGAKLGLSAVGFTAWFAVLGGTAVIPLLLVNSDLHWARKELRLR